MPAAHPVGLPAHAHPARFVRVAMRSQMGNVASAAAIVHMHVGSNTIASLTLRVFMVGEGFMVGAGYHFSYAGLIEALKGVSKKKRRIDTRDQAAAALHEAAKQFDDIFAGMRAPNLNRVRCDNAYVPMCSP